MAIPSEKEPTVVVDRLASHSSFVLFALEHITIVAFERLHFLGYKGVSGGK